jgi:hypothetical protein
MDKSTRHSELPTTPAPEFVLTVCKQDTVATSPLAQSRRKSNDYIEMTKARQIISYHISASFLNFYGFQQDITL